MLDFRGRHDPRRRRDAVADRPADADRPAVAVDDAVRRDEVIPDIDWRHWPPGTEYSVFTAPSGGLSSVALGPAEGQRVLLVPGATGSKEDFLLLAPPLVAAGFRVESFDLAGQYESAPAGPWNLDPPRAHYDERLFVDDLIAVLDSRLAPAHVLGYSFAGTVAQRALSERPDRFASLTLLSAPPLVGQVFRGLKRIGPISGAATAGQGAGLMLWGIRNNLNRVPPGRLAFVRARFALTRRDSVADIIGLMMRTPDLTGPTARATIPKLVAVGEHDLWPRSLHARFAAEIGARLAIYRAGHSPCEQSPNQLARDMLALFAEADLTT